jgi:hypothetical protein
VHSSNILKNPGIPYKSALNSQVDFSNLGGHQLLNIPAGIKVLIF